MSTIVDRMVDHDARLVPVSGAANLRDLGGWPTAGGGHVRRGRVYRGDDLADLTDDDVRTLVDGLGVRTVVDLRSIDELRRAPDRLPADEVRLLHRPLQVPPRHPANVLEEQEEIDLAERYLDYLECGPDQVCAALDAIADGCDEPVLVHCSAGKDRTGVVAALLLSLLDVAPAAIVSDYAFTEMRIDQVFARLRARPSLGAAMAHLPSAMAHAHPATMRGFLTALATRHGSALSWAISAGLSTTTVFELRRRLVVPA